MQDTVTTPNQQNAVSRGSHVAAFVSSLATAWRAGEVQPTHRREPKPGRWRRSRKDPFAEVWPVLLVWLEEGPDLVAKEMLKRLQASGYGEFPDSQLRTLHAECGCGGCESFSWSTVAMKLHRTTMKVLISITQMESPQDG
jgi:hypothetical protein